MLLTSERRLPDGSIPFISVASIVRICIFSVHFYIMIKNKPLNTSELKIAILKMAETHVPAISA